MGMVTFRKSCTVKIILEIKGELIPLSTYMELEMEVIIFGINCYKGGGPLPEMIEKLIRQKDLEGVPKVKMNNVDEFFQKVEEEDAVKKGVVTWDGELFFELHNGTYTSQANNKKYNRQCEIALRSAELFSVFNILVEKIRDTTGGVYDKALFDTCWKDVLLYQFHDVIPGSSIVTVYDTTNASYPQILTSLDENIKASFEGIVSNFIKLKPVGSQENAAIFFNSLHFARQEVIGLQVGDTKIYTRVQIPQLGLAVYPINNLLSNPIPNALINYKIENKIIKIETPQLLLEIPEKTGEITSIKDKETGDLSFPEIKELIKGDTEFTGGNRLCIHNDVPLYWDAWDLWVYYMESRVDIFPESDSPQITELPHQLQITFKYKIPQTKGTQQQSSVSLTICVNAYTKRIDFKMEVHWYENHRILRVYFPLNIKTNFVTCDIQYGNLRRVNHSNTSWYTFL
jgi:alpha-mannosidase